LTNNSTDTKVTNGGRDMMQKLSTVVELKEGTYLSRGLARGSFPGGRQERLK